MLKLFKFIKLKSISRRGLAAATIAALISCGHPQAHSDERPGPALVPQANPDTAPASSSAAVTDAEKTPPASPPAVVPSNPPAPPPVLAPSNPPAPPAAETPSNPPPPAPPPPPLPPRATEVSKGFKAKCAGCHGSTGTGGFAKIDLTKAALDFTLFKTTVRNGTTGMPKRTETQYSPADLSADFYFFTGTPAL